MEVVNTGQCATDNETSNEHNSGNPQTNWKHEVHRDENDGREYVELHVIGEVPGPSDALVFHSPRIDVVDVEEVRPPVALTVFVATTLLPGSLGVPRSIT